MSKIVIVVSGGLVQSVYSESNDVDVQVIDYDILHESGKSHEEVSEILNKEVDAMYDNRINIVGEDFEEN